ncbi:sialate O-acetylesterase [Pedobacter ureilyticus]|uniref:sialate O-acetylesterase n=1 Tax=Pedobacter ureilyticus TaxID=1393051 RepID=UPI001B8C3C10|nr:sialate O-acetylesterase [Pedobacter helvus]
MIFCFARVEAKITLPAYFSSNMVLQQNAEITLKGKASPTNQIMLVTSWDQKKYTTWTDQAGDFKIKIKTRSYGGPYLMALSGDGMAIKFENIMIGDVWMCSGQSNMEMPLAGWGKINHYEREIAEANYPNIRLLQMVHTTSNFPSNEAVVQNAGWNVCSPTSIPEFSATAYFFAREVYKHTGIPIGLIHSSWGGTVAEAWTSPETIAKISDFQVALNNVRKNDSEDVYLNQISAWNKELNQLDKGLKGGAAIWAKAGLDDANWKQMNLPAFFDLNEKPNFDGVVWFRKKVNIPQYWANQDLTLSLGTIDDNDVTYFDGKEIGSTKGYDRERRYIIPKSQITAGEHVITVKVFDGGGGGGIYGNADNFYLQVGNQKQDLSGLWKYNIGVDLKDFKPMPQPNNGPNRPTVLYNAMIHPFISFPIKGVIWYQGESNAGRAKQYQTLFPSLINDWREKWNKPSLPFYFVQLANYTRGEGDETSWALLREAQLKTLQLSNTGMVTSIDIGDAADIHPKNKQDVGKRLALIALAKTYGKSIYFSGPVFQSISVDKSEITVRFKYNTDIKATSGTLTGFTVAGPDQKFYPSNAVIKDGNVVLTSPNVSNPVAVRYAWANNPVANLTNSSGLPASPFRTDTW